MGARLAAFVVVAGLVSLAFLLARHGGSDWAVAWNGESLRGIPIWLAATIAASALLSGPSLIVLVIWRVARQ